MTERFPSHPSTDQLVGLADGELPAPDAEAARRHLEHCAECRQELAGVQAALADYGRYHGRVLKPSLPVPPRPWADLHLEPATPSRVVPFPHKWLAVAAAAMVATVVYWRFESAPRVSAAELLQKAEAVERVPGPEQRIRVESARRSIVRPASLPAARAPETPADAELRSLFASARYDWDEPLSVRSYVTWRRQLAQKEDDVRMSERGSRRVYLVRTRTESNPLMEATLALREGDLHAVRGTLRFRTAGVVELAEIVEGAAPPPARIAPPDPVPPAPSARPVTPAEELQVIAALHRLAADLGEPVEVERRPASVSVSGMGLGERREAELRQALAGLPFVEMHFEQGAAAAPQTGGRRSEQRAPRFASELETLVESRLNGRLTFEQFVNEALDASDAIMARAHAVRALATRFPKPVAHSLAPAGRALLADIRHDHVQALSQSLAQLQARLAAGFPPPATNALALPPVPGDWQAQAPALVAAAGRLDRLLTETLSGGNMGSPREIEQIWEALAQVRAHAASGVPE